MRKRPKHPSSPNELNLTYEAQQYLQEVEKRRQEVLSRMRRLPVAALIWGPSVSENTPVGQARVLLKESLMQEGHLARFSEELYDSNSNFSLLAQQVAQIESHDIVFSIPDSNGSIAEIHEFARLPGISRKIITFLDYKWDDGYSNKTLTELRSTVTCDIVMYDNQQLPHCIIDKSLDLARRLQESAWIWGRRI